MRKQAQRVLDYMDEFGGITSYEAFQDLGITRLSAVVYDLRHEGINIDSETVHKKNRYGEQTAFSRYFIPKKETI